MYGFRDIQQHGFGDRQINILKVHHFENLQNKVFV